MKFIATHHISNVTGCEQNIKKITQLASVFKIPVLVDGAQAVAHSSVNVSDLDCAFYCFSGHKVFGPTGTGVLFGKEKFLQLSLGGNQNDQALTLLKTGAENGSWVFLKNLHLVPRFLPILEKELEYGLRLVQ